MTTQPSPPRSAAPALADEGRAARHAMTRSALPDHLDRLTWSHEQLATHQRDALRRVLRVAVDRSPFHRDRLGGIDPEHFELHDLTSLPVMTKSDMMRNFDDVVTDRRLTRELVEHHLGHTGWDATELLDEFIVIASGGSSGERGVFVYDRRAAADFVMAVSRMGLARIVSLFGGIPEDPVPLTVVAAACGVHATRALPSLFSGDLMSATSIPATDPLPGIVARLNELQPPLLQGFPSMLRRLAEEKLAGRLAISPLAVTSTSEALAAEDRARIDEAFGVGISDLFASSEGLIAMSPPDDPVLIVTSDLSLIELVDIDGRPVPPGTPSAKVLLTNLFNHAQPLIRYELSDSFTREPDAGLVGHVRVRAQGRCDEDLRFGDLVVHPLAVRTVLVTTPEAVEYQVRQTPRGITIDVVALEGFDAERLRARLVASLATAGLPDADVQVRQVDAASIERHPNTGKTRRFIPLPA